MRLFISAGEPSGDLHGANLLHSLRAKLPQTVCAGFGGERLRRAGCDVLFPLANHSIMGLTGIVSALPTLVRLRRQMTDWIAASRPDAVAVATQCARAPATPGWLATSAVTGQGLTELRALVADRARARKAPALAPTSTKYDPGDRGRLSRDSVAVPPGARRGRR